MAASVDARMVAWVDGESINAGGLRLGQAASSMGGATALASRGGVRPSGGEPGLIAALPTPGMKVRVTPGIFVLPSASPTGGEYRIALEAQTDLDIDNSGSFPRTDLVIAEVVDTGTSAATATVRVLKGPTDSPGAARPTNTTPNAHYIVLGSVDVRVGAESGGNIRAQDVHPERTWAVAAGALVPVESQVERDALTAYDGLSVIRLDTGQIEFYRAGEWRTVPSNDDTGWQPLAANSAAGWNTPAAASTAARYRRLGNTVHMDGILRNNAGLTTPGAYAFATLPAGYRPSAEQRLIVAGWVSGGTTAPYPDELIVGTTGVVTLTVQANRTGTYLSGVSWLTD